MNYEMKQWNLEAIDTAIFTEDMDDSPSLSYHSSGDCDDIAHMYIQYEVLALFWV